MMIERHVLIHLEDVQTDNVKRNDNTSTYGFDLTGFARTYPNKRQLKGQDESYSMKQGSFVSGVILPLQIPTDYQGPHRQK